LSVDEDAAVIRRAVADASTRLGVRRLIEGLARIGAGCGGLVVVLVLLRSVSPLDLVGLGAAAGVVALGIGVGIALATRPGSVEGARALDRAEPAADDLVATAHEHAGTPGLGAALVRAEARARLEEVPVRRAVPLVPGQRTMLVAAPALLAAAAVLATVLPAHRTPAERAADELERFAATLEDAAGSLEARRDLPAEVRERARVVADAADALTARAAARALDDSLARAAADAELADVLANVLTEQAGGTGGSQPGLGSLDATWSPAEIEQALASLPDEVRERASVLAAALADDSPDRIEAELVRLEQMRKSPVASERLRWHTRWRAGESALATALGGGALSGGGASTGETGPATPTDEEVGEELASAARIAATARWRARRPSAAAAALTHRYLTLLEGEDVR
jgi:hypothetical protein